MVVVAARTGTAGVRRAIVRIRGVRWSSGGVEAAGRI